MNNAPSSRRVCLVGAGYISSVHAEALRDLGIPIAAVVDPNLVAREKLAAAFGIPCSFATIDEALAAGGFGRAHVLVPPDLHDTVARTLLQAGKALLVEKPLATTVEQCDALIAAAGETPLGVNQNFVFHPAFARLLQTVESNELGSLRAVNVIYHAPLRQLSSRQFGHWMFREPRNILLEQAVHPLSQMLRLCGQVKALSALGAEPVEIVPGAKFVLSFDAVLNCRRAPVALRFSVGEDFPFWQVRVVCADGVAFADILANRFWRATRTRWLESVDNLVSGQRSAFDIAGTSWKNFFDYGLSALRLRSRSDPFYQSMRASIAAFHAAVDSAVPPPLDGAFGRELVGLVDRVAKDILPIGEGRTARGLSAPGDGGACDVAVLGGTGFIGTALVTQLRAAGLRVAVMARNLAGLPPIFHEDGVALYRGDIRSVADVERATAGAKCVVNLAHGGGGGSWEEIRAAMLGGAETVAKACMRDGGKPLIHVGSIAALYLGPQETKITGATPRDPKAEQRADYASAKALCEDRLLELVRSDGLRLMILRPGLVVGQGTSPFHSGLGIFNNEQHCIGWNAGRNPLPFVLVDDVAQAIVLACRQRIEGAKCYNLVGDYRPNARDYLAELARTLRRPLRFHAKTAEGLYLAELGKWSIKRLGGRRAAAPSLRDFLSRGLKAEFDCSDAKADLGWVPVADRATFYDQAFAASPAP